MGDPGSKKFSNEFWLTILIFSITTAFGCGLALAEFQTKAEAEKTKKELVDYMDKNYMPRELSLEKWRNNDEAHKQIMEGQTEILKAVRLRQTK